MAERVALTTIENSVQFVVAPQIDELPVKQQLLARAVRASAAKMIFEQPEVAEMRGRAERAMAGWDAQWPFEIVNALQGVGEFLGVSDSHLGDQVKTEVFGHFGFSKIPGGVVDTEVKELMVRCWDLMTPDQKKELSKPGVRTGEMIARFKGEQSLV